MPDAESGVAYILRRNRELAAVLKRARLSSGKTIMQCADEIGTYRQRYAAIERGEEPVKAAELEVLVHYLRIPSYAVWPIEQPGTGTRERVVYVHPDEGESLHIIVGPYDLEAVPKPTDGEEAGKDERLGVTYSPWLRVRGIGDEEKG